MTRIEINECDNIEKLKQLCLEYRKQLCTVSEMLVTESKQECDAENTISKMRDYLTKNQFNLHL